MSTEIKILLLSAISFSIISSLTVTLLGSTKFIKAVRFICSLFALLILLNVFKPFISAIKNITVDFDGDSYIDSSDIYSENLTKEAGKQICSSIKDAITAKFGLEKESFTVTATLEKNDVGEIEIKHVAVELLCKVPFDARLISDFVSQTLLCECTVLTAQ